jgi:hypothetical protein
MKPPGHRGSPGGTEKKASKENAEQGAEAGRRFALSGAMSRYGRRVFSEEPPGGRPGASIAAGSTGRDGDIPSAQKVEYLNKEIVSGEDERSEISASSTILSARSCGEAQPGDPSK